MPSRKVPYIEKIAHEVWWATGETVPSYPPEEASLWLGYAVLVLVKGEATTSEDVHEAWSAWATVAHNGQHRSLIPFEELTPEVQAYDDLYRDAIHRVAQNHAPHVRFSEWGERVPKPLGDVSITVHFHNASLGPDDVSKVVHQAMTEAMDGRPRVHAAPPSVYVSPPNTDGID